MDLAIIGVAGWRTDHLRRRTPPGTLRKARSQFDPGIGRGKAGHGRAGQAFALVESGLVDRATANSLPRTAVGHKQDDQAAETKPPSGSCSRILDQSLEPTRVRSFKEPAARTSQRSRQACSRVGWTIPSHSRQNNSLRIEHLIRTLTHSALVTRRSNQDSCLSCENSLLE